MSTSADPLAKATALLLKPLIADLERIQKEVGVLPCESKDCLLAAAATAGASWMSKPDAGAQAAFDELARMAAGNPDPRIYALAFHACGVYKAERVGACQLISAEQWARLDADNAVPWNFVAAQARQRNDDATVREAMHRIGQARRSHVGWGDTLKLVIDHAPADEALLEGSLALVGSVVSVQASWVLPGYQAITQFCKSEAVLDGNRRQTCSAIAEVLTEKSDTMLEQAIGTGIGQRAGWPEARVEALKKERDEVTQAMGLLTNQISEPICADFRQSLDNFRQMGIDGEMGAMRRWVAQSPPILRARGGDRAKAASYPEQGK